MMVVGWIGLMMPYNQKGSLVVGFIGFGLSLDIIFLTGISKKKFAALSNLPYW